MKLVLEVRMQFGSIFKMRPRAGKNQALVGLFKAGRRPADMKRFGTAHVFDCGDEVWGVAVFKSEKAYRDNANDPGQDKEYRRMREALESDPEWHDGNVESIVA